MRRFKTWLLNQASWRVKDQLTRRRRNQRLIEADAPAGESDGKGVEEFPDQAALDLDALFEAEWRKNVVTAALEVVKTKFSLKQFQMFDLLVFKEWPAAEVAKSLGVTLANVYVTKHRFAAALKKEVARQEKNLK